MECKEPQVCSVPSSVRFSSQQLHQSAPLTKIRIKTRASNLKQNLISSSVCSTSGSQHISSSLSSSPGAHDDFHTFFQLRRLTSCCLTFVFRAVHQMKCDFPLIQIQILYVSHSVQRHLGSFNQQEPHTCLSSV